MIRVKVCGITRLEDALQAAGDGADYLGFIFAPSPRRCDPGTANRIAVQLEREYPDVGRVGVFVDPTADELVASIECGRLTHIQIHGRIPDPLPDRVPWIRAIRMHGPADRPILSQEPWAVLAEPRVKGFHGGTGRTFPWEWAEPLREPYRLFVAGGLDADKVRLLLSRFEPFGVDAASKLEGLPGIKDAAKVRAFIRAAHDHESLAGGQ